MSSRAILLIPLLVLACALLGGKRPPEVGSPESVLPPCFKPTDVDTTGWQVVHLFSKPIAFLLPAAFRVDSTAEFRHGGVKWVDGHRTLEQANGVWSPSSFGEGVGHYECEDTLAGIRYLLVTTYWPSYPGYAVVAMPLKIDPKSLGYSEALIGMSPDSLDQRLFLTIFRTFRSDPTWRLKQGTGKVRR